MFEKFANHFSKQRSLSFSNEIAKKLFDTATIKLIKNKKKREKKPFVLEALNKQVIPATVLTTRLDSYKRIRPNDPILISSIKDAMATVADTTKSRDEKMEAYNGILRHSIEPAELRKTNTRPSFRSANQHSQLIEPAELRGPTMRAVRRNQRNQSSRRRNPSPPIYRSHDGKRINVDGRPIFSNDQGEYVIYGGHTKLSKKPKKLSKKSTTKKKSPKVHIGPRGGKYIIKKGQKIYK